LEKDKYEPSSTFGDSNPNEHIQYNKHTSKDPTTNLNPNPTSKLIVPEQNVQANLSQDEMRTLENLLKKVNSNPGLLNMINAQPDHKRERERESKHNVSNHGNNMGTNDKFNQNTNINTSKSHHGYKKDDILKRKRSMDRERSMSLSQHDQNPNGFKFNK